MIDRKLFAALVGAGSATVAAAVETPKPSSVRFSLESQVYCECKSAMYRTNSDYDAVSGQFSDGRNFVDYNKPMSWFCVNRYCSHFAKGYNVDQSVKAVPV